MRKIFLILIALSITFFNFEICQAANLVRVSDYTVNEFYREYNNVANNVTKNGWVADKSPILGHNGVDFDNYLMFSGPKDGGRATAIILKANKEGHVSEISIMIPFPDSYALQIGGLIFKNIVITLGLSEEDGANMLNDIQNGNNPTGRYCYKTKRYILMKAHMDDSSTFFVIDLAAAVD